METIADRMLTPMTLAERFPMPPVGMIPVKADMFYPPAIPKKHLVGYYIAGGVVVVLAGYALYVIIDEIIDSAQKRAR